MASPNLRNFYTITTTATSADNVTSIASFEAKRYPFYGLQFHPEKNIYEWNQPSIPKTAQAIQVINNSLFFHLCILKLGLKAAQIMNYNFAHAQQVGQYFGEFFVNQGTY